MYHSTKLPVTNPLLFQTPPTHIDQEYIEQTVRVFLIKVIINTCIMMCIILCMKITAFDSLIQDIDRCTGIAKCRDIIDRLDYLHNEQVLI